jgi:hypothetical protein
MTLIRVFETRDVTTIDTRFVLEVQPTTKVTYVSIDELTKRRVSFNHNLL